MLDVIKAIRNKTASPNTLFALDDPDGYVIAQQISEGFLFQTTEVDRRKFYLPIILKTTNAGFEGDGMRDVATYVLYTGVEVYPSVLGSGKQAFVFVDKGK